jgi:HlyD family secretion protein
LKLRKILTWLSIILLIAGAVGGYFWLQQRKLSSANAAEILRSAVIQRGDMVINVPVSGSIAGQQSSDLRFTIPGQVQEVNVKVGDFVTVGEVLAKTDSRDLQRAVEIAAIAREQAELNLSSIKKPADQHDIELAEISVQSSKQALAVSALNKELAADQASLSNRIAQEVRDDVRQAYLDFQKTLERYNLPYVYGAGITAANMEAEGNVGITALKGNFNIQQAESSWWAAYNALQQAEQSLADLINDVDDDRIRQVELDIQQAQLNLEQAQQRLKDTVIIAPYDGTITAVNLTKGIISPVNSPAISILDDSTFFVDVTIDEIDIAKIKLEQKADIVLDAYPDNALIGSVKYIEDVPINLTGIISYKVRISIDDIGSTHPRDGMTANVFITTGTVDDVLLVPNWAIRTDQTTTETYVYCHCLVDGMPQRKIIETGLRNETFTQVLSGLEEGATVVLVAEERNLFDMSGPPHSFGN